MDGDVEQIDEFIARDVEYVGMDISGIDEFRFRAMRDFGNRSLETSEVTYFPRSFMVDDELAVSIVSAFVYPGDGSPLQNELAILLAEVESGKISRLWAFDSVTHEGLW